MPTTDKLVKLIDDLVVPTVRSEQELMKVEQRRSELADQLVARGLPAQKKVLSLLLERGHEAATRQFWMQVLLRFEQGSPARFVNRLSKLPVEDWELQTLSAALHRFSEKWALDWALRFVSSDEWALRQNAMKALVQWDHPAALKAVLDRLKNDENMFVRREAATFGIHACFSGTERELSALVEATTDRELVVVAVADKTLRRIIDPSLDTPENRLLPPTQAADLRVVHADWKGWYDKHRGSIVWDPRARRFVPRPS